MFMRAEVIRNISRLNREISLLEGQLEDKRNEKAGLVRALNHMEEPWRSTKTPHSSP
jgi:hypothetical protein